MCEYCDNMERIKSRKKKENVLTGVSSVFGSDIVFEAYISGTSLELVANGNYDYPIAERFIKYCPMCGRKIVHSK